MTLLISCLLTAAWVRSYLVTDEFCVSQQGEVTHHAISNYSRLAWKTITLKDPQSLRFNATRYFSNPARRDHLYSFWGKDPQWEWRRQFLGFEFGVFEANGFPADQRIWVVPYWPIVIPLTGLSAWPLLSKPRQSGRPDTSEQKPAG